MPAPVRLEVALVVRLGPEAAGHPRPRRPDRELADRAPDGRPRRVDDVGRHPDARAVEARRADRSEQRAADDPAADLGAARVVDDRQPTAADDVEAPPPRVRVPRLAGRAEDPQRREVVVADRRLAMDAERPDERRADAEMGDPMTRHERPQPAGVGPVGRALVDDQPRAEQQRPADRPRAHHPAEVGEPAQRVARAQVERVGEVLGGLDREAAVDVDGALRLAGRARGVDHHVRRLGVGQRHRRRRPRAAGPASPRPAPRTTRRPGPASIGTSSAVAPEPPDDDDRPDRRRRARPPRRRSP